MSLVSAQFWHAAGTGTPAPAAAAPRKGSPVEPGSAASLRSDVRHQWHTGRMTAWHDYQERAADFFRTLGMNANVDERLEGVRGQHDVDVAVRATRAGIQQLWVVECKLWRRPVTKAEVATLAHIVEDVGADRGIMLSETGFQAGAIRLASLSNITLTSLAVLDEDAKAVDLPILAATLTGVWFLGALGPLCQSLNPSNSGHNGILHWPTLVHGLADEILNLEEPKNPVDLSRYRA